MLLYLLKRLVHEFVIYFFLAIGVSIIYIMVEPIIKKDETINKEIEELKNQNTEEAREKFKEVMKKKAPW